MNSKRNLTVIVSDKDGNKTTFALRVHQSERDEDRNIELAWYKEKGQVPVGIHNEVESLSVEPDCGDRRADHLNFHQSKKTGTEHMCFPYSMPTKERVEFIATLWAMGTVHAVHTGAGLVEVMEKFSFDENITRAWYEGEVGYSVTILPSAS